VKANVESQSALPDASELDASETGTDRFMVIHPSQCELERKMMNPLQVGLRWINRGAQRIDN
jgi:hypothetical protein